MDGLNFDRVRVLLACRLCSNLTKDPRILDCNHNFCLNCLQNQPELSPDSDQARCPQCKVIFQVPNGGVEYLKLNEFLVKFYETCMASMLCDACSSKMAEKSCEQCNQHYCGTCSGHHHKIQATKDHVLTLLEGVNLEDNEFLLCQDHYKDIDLFCTACSQFVCIKCFKSNHNEHNMMLITEKFEVVKAHLTGIVTSKSEILRRLSQELLTLEPLRKEAGRNADDIRAAVRHRGEEIKNTVANQVAALCIQVDSNLDAYQAKIDSVLEILENLQTNVGSDMKTYENQIRDLNLKTVTSYATQLPQEPYPEIPMFKDKFGLEFITSKDGEIFTTENVVGTISENPVSGEGTN